MLSLYVCYVSSWIYVSREWWWCLQLIEVCMCQLPISIFTVLHTMHGGISHQRNVLPPVCQTHEFWENERNPIFLYHMKGRQFSDTKNGWCMGDASCTWNFEPNWPRFFENANFQSIFARSTSTVTPSFPLRLRWTPYVAPGLEKRSNFVLEKSGKPQISVWILWV